MSTILIVIASCSVCVCILFQLSYNYPSRFKNNVFVPPLECICKKLNIISISQNSVLMSFSDTPQVEPSHHTTHQSLDLYPPEICPSTIPISPNPKVGLFNSTKVTCYWYTTSIYLYKFSFYLQVIFLKSDCNKAYF